MSGFPNAQFFNSRRVTNPAQSEVVRQRFYDYVIYPAAGVQQLSMFSLPVGQGVTSAVGAVAGSSKTNFDTNLEMGNTLPSGKSFLIESLEVIFTPGSSAAANAYTPAAIAAFNVAAAVTALQQLNDSNVVSQAGLLELNISSKNYLRETPLAAFPPKTFLEPVADVATNSATVGLISVVHSKTAGRPYFCEPEITLQPAVNFEVLLRFPAAVPLPSGFNGRIGVVLDGYFMRASQ